jgi:hypothetical protein
MTVHRMSGPKSSNGSEDNGTGAACCVTVVVARARFLFGIKRLESATSEARAILVLALTIMFHTRVFEATLRYLWRQDLTLLRVLSLLFYVQMFSTLQT